MRNIIGVAVAVLAASCTSPGTPPGGNGHDAGVTGSFALSLSAISVNVTQGNSATLTVTVAPLDGFTGQVTLLLEGAPTGVTGVFSPNPVGATTSTLTLNVGNSATVGGHAISVKGASGSLSTTTSLTVNVASSAVPDFQLAVTPSAPFAFPHAYTGKLSVQLTRLNGFNEAVSLVLEEATSGSVADFSPTFSPTSLSGGTTQSDLTLTTGAGTGVQKRTLRIRGTAATTTTLTHFVDVDAWLGAPSTAQVEITGSTFIPSEIVIEVNGTVSWRNNDGVPHTATATNSSFDTGNIGTGATSSTQTFSATGLIPYICSIHGSSMNGAVRVVGTKPAP